MPWVVEIRQPQDKTDIEWWVSDAYFFVEEEEANSFYQSKQELLEIRDFIEITEPKEISSGCFTYYFHMPG